MTVTLLRGHGKNGQPETFAPLTLATGDLAVVVGNTGSGKSRLLKDIEQLAYGDSVTGRRALIDGKPVPLEDRAAVSTRLVSHLSQNMRFTLDMEVSEFITLHQACKSGSHRPVEEIIRLANGITPEPIFPGQLLATLSGGQSRALMIADIAMVGESPLVLIDEVENAGIDKMAAFRALLDHNKLLLIVTHDPHTALMADTRIILEGGAITALRRRTPEEARLFEDLSHQYNAQLQLQIRLRKGETLI